MKFGLFQWPLYQGGYSLLAYDARSHGESAKVPAPSGISMRDDFLSALDYAMARPDVDSTRIGVLGHSLGAFGSIVALGHGAGHKLRAVVTDAMPARAHNMMKNELQRRGIPLFPLVYLLPWIWFKRSHVTQEDTQLDVPINGCNVPVLMTHSRGDGAVPVTEMDYVRSIVRRSNVEFFYLECEGHNTSADQPSFWEQVLPFFREHLKPLEQESSCRVENRL